MFIVLFAGVVKVLGGLGRGASAVRPCEGPVVSGCDWVFEPLAGGKGSRGPRGAERAHGDEVSPWGALMRVIAGK